MQQPLLLTMDTKPDEYSLRFIKTLTNNDWQFRLIGTDTKWVSFLNRIILYKQELSKVDPNKICVVSDCRDVLCLRSSKHFIEAFMQFNSNIVASGELLCGGYTDPKFRGNDLKRYNCEPLVKYWNHLGYKDSLPNRKYVNAGLIAGFAKDLINMYDWMINTGLNIGEKDDQVLMGMFMNENPDSIKIDIDAKILHTSTFACTAGYLSREQKGDSPTIAQVLGHSSFFLHLPGISSKKGNYVVYNMIATLIDAGFSNKNLLDAYEIKGDIPYDWYQEENM